LDNDDVDVNMVWDIITKNINASPIVSLHFYELKQHKPWFDECSKLLEHRKQNKLQWLENQTKTKGNNLNNVRCETKILRKKRDKYIKK
jgi:hypothetical protein